MLSVTFFSQMTSSMNTVGNEINKLCEKETYRLWITDSYGNGFPSVALHTMEDPFLATLIFSIHGIYL